MKVEDLITGKAKELFLKWFRNEKLMTGFDDHSELVQIFALNEWFGTVGYKISIISRFIQEDFGYKLSISVGDFEKYGISTRLEAEKLAIQKANEDFNNRYSEAII